MKIQLLLITLILSCTISKSQNWTYVGSPSVSGNSVSILNYGTAKTVFKSDGTPISVSFSSGSGGGLIKARTFNGTAWVDLGLITTTTTIGAIDLEIYNNEPYLAFLESGALKVRKYDGTGWVNVGTNLPGYSSSQNFDFAIDNTGTLYVACNDRKIFKFNGTSWNLLYTLPQTAGSITFSYYFFGDNTVTFNSANDLVYNVTSNAFLSPVYKQFVRKFNGTSESVVGDTILFNGGFTSYSNTKIYTNSSNELFSFFHKPISNNLVLKKFNGTNWMNYGDTSNFRKDFGLSTLTFSSPNSFFIASQGIQRKVFYCSGSTSNFQLIDTLNITGTSNLAQITDLGIHPTTNEIYATFNSLNSLPGDYSVMKHSPLITGLNNNALIENNQLHVYPNPCKSHLYINGNNLKLVKIFSNDGQLIYNDKITSNVIDVNFLKAGLYIIEIADEKYELNRIRLIKE
jgi:hypothetical protein